MSHLHGDSSGMDGREIASLMLRPHEPDTPPQNEANQGELFSTSTLREPPERSPVHQERTANGFRVVRVNSCRIGNERYANVTVAVGPAVLDRIVYASTDEVAWPWYLVASDTARKRAEEQVLSAAREALRGGRPA